jgi:hypothetical protein
MSKQRNVLKMSKQKTVLEKGLNLDAVQQASFLDEHIPNRVCAAWVGLPGIKGEWECKQQRPLGREDFTVNVDPNEVWCICRAVEHGQKVAMRWLIEFVGIRLDRDDKNGRPAHPRRHAKDVSIQSFVADGSDLEVTLDTADQSSKAWILGRVWQGCSQSCVHSTYRTDHYRADPPELAEAFSIIVEHLQTKLYGPRGKRLIEIVKSKK